MSTEPSRDGSRSRITRATSGSGRCSSWYGRRSASSSKRITPRAYTSERRVERGGVAGDLLGAHVAERAEQLAGLGPAGGRAQVGVGGAGDAEVEHLGLAGLVHQDVAGLEVAVDDALVVGVLHRVADPRQQLQRVRRVEAAAGGRTRPAAARG